MLSQDNANLFFDDANNNLLLFGGAVGGTGQKVLALGPGVGPTAIGTDTVQIWTKENYQDLAGSRGLHIVDETGFNYRIGDGGIYLQHIYPAAALRPDANKNMIFTDSYGYLYTRRSDGKELWMVTPQEFENTRVTYGAAAGGPTNSANLTFDGSLLSVNSTINTSIVNASSHVSAVTALHAPFVTTGAIPYGTSSGWLNGSASFLSFVPVGSCILNVQNGTDAVFRATAASGGNATSFYSAGTGTAFGSAGVGGSGIYAAHRGDLIMWNSAGQMNLTVAGALQRYVTTGGPDSGGAGYRMLIIAN